MAFWWKCRARLKRTNPRKLVAGMGSSPKSLGKSAEAADRSVRATSDEFLTQTPTYRAPMRPPVLRHQHHGGLPAVRLLIGRIHHAHLAVVLPWLELVQRNGEL